MERWRYNNTPSLTHHYVEEVTLKPQPLDTQVNGPRKKANVEFSLSTPWRHLGELEVLLNSFLISGLDGGEWLTTRSGRFTSGKNPDSNWIGGNSLT